MSYGASRRNNVYFRIFTIFFILAETVRGFIVNVIKGKSFMETKTFTLIFFTMEA